MSNRSRAAANLVYHLTDKARIDVSVEWDNPSARPGHGAWRVGWTDGPTVKTMHGHAENLVRYCRPLNIDMLRFSRFTTRQAWAAAMLALAHRGDLPERPAMAVAAAEHELADTDTTDWHHLSAHASQLLNETGDDLYQVVALIHATVTKPSHETPTPQTTPGACQRCTAPLSPPGPGRPGRYRSPACRQAAHRTNAAVTKPSNETTCATCGRTFTPTRTGRPARHCSPACRTRAWRRTKGQPR